VIAAPDGRVVASTDTLVEGRHFRLDWSTPRQVGEKAVAQNAADIAAMGARPAAFLVSLACPPGTPLEVLADLSDGFGRAAEALGAGVVGGDLVQAGQLVVSVTVLGSLDGAAPVLISGARAGDVLAVAGNLGRSAAGLAALLAGRGDEPALRGVVASHQVPAPPYALALAAAPLATSLTDNSDGLLSELGHIGDASGVGFSTATGQLPVDAELSDAAAALGFSAREWQLTGGEDHGFAATFPPSARLPEGWRAIGFATEEPGIAVDGRRWEGAIGWDSFE
jgi:thiamine-monophosphate kinase